MTLPLSDLFLRWRDAGDVRALSEVFDRMAPALTRLARRLAGDGHDAEDAVQATFLAALDDAGSYDAARPLAPWLVGILARRVRAERRGRGRTPEPERLAPSPPADPERAAQDAELLEAIERALSELPARYREVLQPRLVEGRRAADIARGLERSPGVVRQQIHRGLELLRRALPAGFAGGVALVSTRRSLARTRGVVLAHGAPSGGVGLAIGAAWMNTKTVVVGVILGVALVSWIAVETRDRAPAVEPDPLARDAPELVARAGSLTGARIEMPTEERADARATGGEPSGGAADASGNGGDRWAGYTAWYLSGRVFGPPGLDHGASAARGTKVRVKGPGVSMEFGVVADDGTFREKLWVGREPWKTIGPDAPAEQRLVRIWATHPRTLDAYVELDASERTSEDGYEVELVLTPAAHVLGRVLHGGEPALGAAVALHALDGNAPRTEALAEGLTNGKGQYAFKTDYSGPAVVVASLPGFRPAHGRVEALLGADADVVPLALERGARLEGRVTLDPDDEPRAVILTSLAVDSPGRAGPVRWDGSGFDWVELRTSVAPDGTFTIGGLAPTIYEVGVEGFAGRSVDLRETAYVDLDD